MNSPALVTVILNWNNAELSIASAESVLLAYASSGVADDALEIALVDNGSDSEDLLTLKSWCDREHAYRVELIANTTNLGFAGGMNDGIKHATRLHAAHVWLLNNDTEVAVDSVHALLEFATHNSHAAVIGATILDQEPGIVSSAGGYRYYPWLGYSRPRGSGLTVDKLDSATLGRLDYIDGAAIWIRGELLQRTAGLPEIHFMYFEELELNEVLAPGEKIAWCPQARVVHHCGASGAPWPAPGPSYQAALSAFRYTWRVHPACLPTVIMARLAGIGYFSLRRLQPALLGAVLRALWAFVLAPAGGAGPPPDHDG